MRRRGLRLYSIHLPPPYSAPGREPEVLREGFNFIAFLLTLLWALANRLWIRAAVLAVIFGVLYGLGALAGLNATGEAIVTLAVMAWTGMEANDWLRAGLTRRGWREDGVIAAENQDAALRRYGDLASLVPPASRNPGGGAAPRSLEGPASA